MHQRAWVKWACLALGCVLVATSLFFVYSGFIHKKQSTAILVAADDLEAGTTLHHPETQLMFKSYTVGSEPPHSFYDREYVRGKILVLPLSKGARLTAEHFPIIKIPVLQEVSVSVKYQGMGVIQPGTRIDLLHVAPDRDDAKKTQAVVILQNALVLAVDTSKITLIPTDGVIEKVMQVTVLVDSDDAPKLFQATQQGPLSVVIRRPGE
jgi:Flp pilus assembly protein CpaB